jgi:hypothetical protein
MKKQTNSHQSMVAMTTAATLGLLLMAATSTVLAGKAKRAADAVWVHDSLYSTVLTDTAFKNPPLHSTDVIFSFAGSGLEGQRAVAEHAPGDRDYNGGRWNVMAVSFTEQGKAIHDADHDGMVNFELTNAEAVLHHAELGHLTIAEPGIYFECPLLPAAQDPLTP